MATAMMDTWKKTQRNTELQGKIAQAPKAFLTWVEDKKASASDLMPLNSFSDLSQAHSLLEIFPQQRLTRSQGRQALDLIADLLLMKTPVDLLHPQQGSWLEQLRQLRYPQTTSRDSEPGLEARDWPQFSKVQKRRSGDRLNYQVTIQFQNLDDLNDKLSRLHKSLDSE